MLMLAPTVRLESPVRVTFDARAPTCPDCRVDLVHDHAAVWVCPRCKVVRLLRWTPTGWVDPTRNPIPHAQ